VVYAEVDGQPLLVDIASPPTRDKPRPAVIVIHPGGMVAGDRTIMEDLTRGLASLGYVAFNIDYRLFVESTGDNPWPAQLEDSQRAVRWIRANAEKYGVDPERVGAFGYSSGGLLAAHLGMKESTDKSDPELASYSSRVTCVVDFAGKSDPTIQAPDPEDTALEAALLGGTPEKAPDAYRDYSVLTHVDGDSVPFLAFHGTKDSVVPVEHSRRLVDTLHTNVIEAVYAEFPHVDHFDWSWELTGALSAAFLGTHLKLKD
jgi:acetyl esterase/lipase